MIKFLISLLFITTNAFSLTPIVKLQFNKNINKNVIHNVNYNSKIVMSIPDYDPSIIINQLAKTSNNLDKYNLKQFLHEVNTHHIDSVSLIKDMNTNTINSLVAIDNNFEGAIPKLENLHYLETGLTKVNNLVIDSLLNNDIYYKIAQISNTNVNNMTPFNGPGFIINVVITYFLFSFILTIIQQFTEAYIFLI